MKTVEEHYRDVLALAAPVEDMTVELAQAQHLVLAEDAVAHNAIPPFTNSAMDGFAVRAADVRPGTVLRVIDDIPAGGFSHLRVTEGTTSRIMTGAPLPAGADAVLKVEDTEGQMANMRATSPSSIVACSEVASGANVRHVGEDIASGAVAFRSGTRINPAHVAALAALGYGTVRVHRRLRIGIIATGQELTTPGQPLEQGRIPDSNSYLVAGLCQDANTTVIPVSLHSDDHLKFISQLERVATKCDLIITTGGISAGAFDVVKAALSSTGVTFAKVAMQPGKPQGWGTINGTPIVCLPGNPVSVFVSFHLFVLPLIRTMQGESGKRFADLFTIGQAGVSWRHKTGRDQFLPAMLGENGVEPAAIGGSGSHLVGSLSKAQFLAVTPANVERINVGDVISVLPFMLI
ncbi:molybdopterin molybdotransferase MoeA [Arcanobacterium phocae]|uniref:molybdopterin molybdotransferase MoeA n=1 Tax=Arcanobacterium phocae TaxID=131112 RepID=UPI001C0EB609